MARDGSVYIVVSDLAGKGPAAFRCSPTSNESELPDVHRLENAAAHELAALLRREGSTLPAGLCDRVFAVLDSHGEQVGPYDRERFRAGREAIRGIAQHSRHAQFADRWRTATGRLTLVADEYPRRVWGTVTAGLAATDLGAWTINATVSHPVVNDLTPTLGYAFAAATVIAAVLGVK
ncbi:MAG: hypothetical protein ACRDPW_07010 [Mycobacteriales bacterium]